MPTAKSSDGINHLSKAVTTLLNNDAVKTEILNRIEAKVDHTNGTVADIQEWRIKHEAEEQTKEEIKNRNQTDYKAPLITGLVVAVAYIAAQIGGAVLHLW